MLLSEELNVPLSQADINYNLAISVTAYEVNYIGYKVQWWKYN